MLSHLSRPSQNTNLKPHRAKPMQHSPHQPTIQGKHQVWGEQLSIHLRDLSQAGWEVRQMALDKHLSYLAAVRSLQSLQNLARVVRLFDSYSVSLTEKSFPPLEHSELGRRIHSCSGKNRSKPPTHPGRTERREGAEVKTSIIL